MPRSRAAVEKALTNKGFVCREGDHRFYFFEHEGLITAIFTKISHGSKYKTLDDSLLSMMARQVRLGNRQFLDLVDCSMTGPDYLEHLRSLGILQ